MRFFGVNYNVGLGSEAWAQLSYDSLKQYMQLLKNNPKVGAAQPRILSFDGR